MNIWKFWAIGIFLFAYRVQAFKIKHHDEANNVTAVFGDPVFPEPEDTLILDSRSLTRSFAADVKTDWCKLAKPAGGAAGTHSMCIYPKGKFGDGCGPIRESVFKKDQIDFILKEHNNRRAKVAKGEEKRGAPGPQPPASNMKALQWDDELAQIAERWAYQCTGGHDNNRISTRFQVGQNVAKYGLSSPVGHEVQEKVNWVKPINGWYDEVELFNKASQRGLGEGTDMRYRMQVGHYTALVWADTYLVGCAAVQWYADSSKSKVSTIYVCNYGPTGNWGGEPLYKVGKACSACEAGETCKDGLCQAAGGQDRNQSATKPKKDKKKKVFVPWRSTISKGKKKKKGKKQSKKNLKRGRKKKKPKKGKWKKNKNKLKHGKRKKNLKHGKKKKWPKKNKGKKKKWLKKNKGKKKKWLKKNKGKKTKWLKKNKGKKPKRGKNKHQKKKKNTKPKWMKKHKKWKKNKKKKHPKKKKRTSAKKAWKKPKGKRNKGQNKKHKNKNNKSKNKRQKHKKNHNKKKKNKHKKKLTAMHKPGYNLPPEHPGLNAKKLAEFYREYEETTEEY